MIYELRNDNIGVDGNLRETLRNRTGLAIEREEEEELGR
jgi:hypothetical protein